MDCSRAIHDQLKNRNRQFPSVRAFMSADEKCVIALKELPEECASAFADIVNDLIVRGGKRDGWEYELQILLRAMGRRGHADVDTFISRALLSKGTRDKNTYVTYLSELGGQASIAALVEFVSNHKISRAADEDAVIAALLTLQQYKSKEPIEKIASLLESKSDQLRLAALNFIAAVDKTRLVKLCQRLLSRENDREIIVRLVDELREIGTPEIKQRLHKFLSRSIIAQDQELRKKVEEASE